MNRILRAIPIAAALSFAASCATPPLPPPPAPPPVPDVPLSLEIEEVRAVPSGLGAVSVAFSLKVRNTEDRAVRLQSLAWNLSVGEEASASGSVSAPPELLPGAELVERIERVVAVPSTQKDAAVYAVRASAVRGLDDGTFLASDASAAGSFPVIREPRFSIRSIKIKKAELINTKFEVVLRIENPNSVPLVLSSLEYELFGEGRLWTDGRNAEPIPVAASGMIDKKLMLVMNFINMKRDLLNQVIKLEVVDYRFKGSARIRAEFDGFPEFAFPFDLIGRTSVVE